MKKNFVLLGKIKQVFHRRNRYFTEAKKDIAVRNIQIMRLICFYGLILMLAFALLASWLIDSWHITLEYILMLVSLVGFFVYSSTIENEESYENGSAQRICVIFYCVFMALFIAQSVFSFPDMSDSCVLVGLLLMPLAFTVRPYVAAIISVVSCVTFCLLALKLKSPEVVNGDIYGVILGFIMSLLETSIVYNFKIKDYFHNIKLLKSSQEDSLTGVLNKAGCEKSCTAFFDTKEPDSPYSLFIIDVDNFKTINDNFGHQCGDKLLMMVGNSLLKVFRSSDIIGRIGGDEFCVLMKNTCNIDTVIIKAEAINRVVGEEARAEIKIPITCSIGIAVGKENEKDYKQVFSIADKALYRAKSEGKNNYIIDLVE